MCANAALLRVFTPVRPAIDDIAVWSASAPSAPTERTVTPDSVACRAYCRHLLRQAARTVSMPAVRSMRRLVDGCTGRARCSVMRDEVAAASQGARRISLSASAGLT